MASLWGNLLKGVGNALVSGAQQIKDTADSLSASKGTSSSSGVSGSSSIGSQTSTNRTTSSSSGNRTTSTPQGLTTSQEMREEMARNSAAWHTATTQAEKDALHQRNQELAAQLDAFNKTETTFDPSTGKYTVTQNGQPFLIDQNYAGGVYYGNSKAFPNETNWVDNSEKGYTTVQDGGQRGHIDPGTIFTNVGYPSATDREFSGYAGVTGLPYTGTTSSGGTGTGGTTATAGSAVDDNGNTDYSLLIQNAIASGADPSLVAALLQQRNAKIAANPSLAPYQYDSTYQAAVNYINQAGNRYQVPEAETTQPQQSSQVDDFSEYIRELNAAARAEALAQLRAAYEQNVNTLDAAEESLPDGYQAARNQLAAQNELSRRNFNQYAAAAGLNTGASSQAQLAQNVAYQNSMAQVDSAEADALAQLQLQRTQLATEYQNAIAQAEATGNYELAAALYEEAVRVDEAMQAQWQYLNSLTQSQNETNYNNGLALAQYLYEATGDASGFASYGYSDAQIAALEAQWRAQNGTGLTTYGTSGGSGSSGSGTTTARRGSYNNGGLTADQVRQMQAYYGTDQDGMWGADSTAAAGGLNADEAWEAYQAAQSSGSGGTAGSGSAGGMSGRAQEIAEYIQANPSNVAASFFAENMIRSARAAGEITLEEANYLSGLLGY